MYKNEHEKSRMIFVIENLPAILTILHFMFSVIF